MTSTTGELRWNIKQSFRNYVSELDDGKEQWMAPTGGIHDGDLVFPAVNVRVGAAGDLVFAFGGAIRFSGYHGMLHVDLADPWVEVDAEGARVTADVAPPGSAERRITVAKAKGAPTSIPNESWEWAVDESTLTSQGAALLGSVYPAGTVAEGFRMTVRPSPEG